MSKKMVVGWETKELKDGRTMVLGIVGVLPTHTVRVKDLYTLAEVLVQYDLEPARVPIEEGWSDVADLPDSMWYELQLILVEREMGTPVYSAT